ncbi:hypothetical protein GE09DRAFT_140157 [Coniochaeta sp. 2T2.1]|nr:hypothetical protein GE09DRAFT_140157 [Coniochaeta sp. 2T2.1]
MFEHYTFGMQARPMRQGSRELSPREVAGTSAQCGEQSQCPSPPLSATAVSLPSSRTRNDSSSAPDSIDRLAQELSRQNLQLDRANLEQLQLQLSSPSLSPQMPCRSPMPPCPELEADHDEPQLYLHNRRRLHNAPTLLPPSAMDIDGRPVMPDAKRLSRQRSSQFHNNPNNTRTIQDMVEGMIASGSQCNVHRTSPPPLTPTSAKRLGPILEPDEDMKLDVSLELQVDDAYLHGPTSDTEKEEAFLIETMMSLRRAGAPAGVRKVGSLQYRASAEAALSCANVVRSRPRMRKRNRMHRRSSKGSSIVSSAFSSPIIPPSLSEESSLMPFRQL